MARIRPKLLQENRYGTLYQSPAQRVLDTSTLNGGLNIWDLDYKLNPNQSPDLVNVYWKDGSLSSREGQEYVYNANDNTGTYYGAYGSLFASYENLWHDFIVAHKGGKIYKINPETGQHVAIYNGPLNDVVGGSFFVFGDKLYYMDGKNYIVINSSFEANPVTPYVPLVIVNRKPDGTGGSIYQDENRLSASKRIQFTTDGTSTAYHIPSGYTPMDNTGVVVQLTAPTNTTYYEKQIYASVSALPATGYANIWYYATAENKYYKWGGAVYSETTAPSESLTFTVNRTTGVITFNTAPPEATVSSPSNITITIAKTDTKTENTVLNCTCVAVYGGDTQLAVVCGGTPVQPNAYFWSGNTANGIDPTYFPVSYYNYAGANAEEYITGFGRQQSMLVIFKERSIGKSYFSQSTVDGMEYLSLPYTPINESIGCNIEKSIRLIQNNLVFANTYGGVYVLLDSTAYGENTVKRISRNINGDGKARTNTLIIRSYDSYESLPTKGELGVYYLDESLNKYYVWDESSETYVVTRMAPPSNGLLYDLKTAGVTEVSSFDDSQRYWLVANGKAYVWDYTVSSYQRNEDNICWFYMENINARSWVHTLDATYYGTANGSIAKFIEQYSDFNESIPRRYTFATQNFGTYEVLKDVLKIVFAVRSDTDTSMTILYKTDYGIRADLTPIRAYSWRLAPRDLTHRSLRPLLFAGTAIRTPRCFHVRHFQMQVYSNTINTDMSIVSAQIIYRFSREDR